MNKIFVTSDTHFGHENIIRYTSRPFRSAGAMDAHMIRTWNARVAEGDTVYHLGDFAMGPGVDATFIAVKLAQLNGHIKFVLGNHDMPSKWSEGFVSFFQNHRSSLPNIEILGKEAFEIKVEGTTFVLFHYPMEDWPSRFCGSVHLHGHSHGRVLAEKPENEEAVRLPNGNWYVSSVPHAEHRYDIGVDSYGGPVQLTGDCRYLNDPKGWSGQIPIGKE